MFQKNGRANSFFENSISHEPFKTPSKSSPKTFSSLKFLSLSSTKTESTSLVIINVIIFILFNLSLVKLSTTTTTIINIENEIIQRCKQDCPYRIKVQDDQLDLACDSTCKINLCQNGCQYWYLSPSSCFQVCHHSANDDNNGSEKSSINQIEPAILIENGFGDRNIYCALGCNHAHTVYLDHVKLLLETNGSLRPPRLVANSLTNESLKIEWNTLDEVIYKQINISYRIQWKYEDLPSQWMYIGAAGIRAYNINDYNNNINDNKNVNTLFINGLNAYTSYLFRIEWILTSSMFGSIISEQSEPITTLPYGVPKSSCIILNCMSISPTQISINWRAPTFPNGPIIAYSLYLINTKTGQRTVKDIHTHWDPFRTSNLAIHSYVFNDLQSDTNYTISIITHNNFGEGIACQRNITTLKQSNNNENNFNDNENDSNNNIHYKLFSASIKSVSRRNIDFLLDEEILYHLTDYIENEDITSMALHYLRRYLFVADSSGTIRRIWLKENSINQVLRIINGSNQPSHLSIDWLNDRLYWLEEPANRIMRSDLDGENIESIFIDSFQPTQKPIDFKVDPYNGYLFWIQANVFNRTAIYRLDLYHLNNMNNNNNNINNQLRSKIELIYQSDSWISTFAINYLNYRLLFPMTHTSSIHSITIDGNDETTIRDISMIAGANRLENDNYSAFNNMSNMVIFNQRLYFTCAENITWEEYHQDEKMYYHNTYTTESYLISLAIMDQQSQPIPIPLTPVESVEAIFLDTSARISWQKPSLFGTSGRGAWQQWRYEVQIQELNNPQIVHTAKVNSVTQCDAVELQPDTSYEIRVRAFTSSGNGKWSNKFIGHTLPSLDNMQDRPYALIATNDRLLIRTELDGKFKQQLLPKSKLNSFDVNNITGVKVYKDSIILNTDKHILLYGSHTVEHSNLNLIVNNSYAFSLAIEWMAPKIYWSNPTERMICRCNLDGTQKEILPIISYAHEIAIDSLNGFLYWSTTSSIHIARLNGMKNTQHIIFRSQQIKSLTIDEFNGKLYWTTISSFDRNSQENNDEMFNLDQDKNILILNHINLIKSIEQIKEINSLSNPIISTRLLRKQSYNLYGPMASFAHKYWWLNLVENQIVISDDSLKTFATIKQLNYKINTFNIVTNMDRFNENKENFVVVPEPVDKNSIKIDGTWENFKIKWQPVTNTNYAQIFYDLTIENDNNESLNTTINHNENVNNNFITNQTEIILPDHLKPLKPYSKIRIAIRTFTYWSSSKQIITSLHTPSSIPSKPRSVRIFTNIMNDNDKLNPKNVRNDKEYYMAEARWLEPENPNGLIQSYTISLWTMDSGNKTSNVISIINKIIPNQLWYRFENLKPNSTYYFEVRATTEVGEGPPSQVIQFKTFRSQPPMKLLLAERDTIFESDMDLKQIVRSVVKSLSPSLMDYNYAENRLYFVEDGNFVKFSKLMSNIGANNQNDDDLDNEIMNSKLQSGQSKNYTILAHFTQTITSIAMDWLGRRLYISTVDYFHNQSIVWCYTEEAQSKRIVFKLKGLYIDMLRVDPFRSMLIWTQRSITMKLSNRFKYHEQLNKNLITIQRCRLSLNGHQCNEQSNYFQLPNNEHLCNCTYEPNLSGSFQIIKENDRFDNFNAGQQLIYFDQNERIFMKSLNGCYCYRITSYIKTDNPPISIEHDEITSKLYWKNDTINGLIFYTNLNTESYDSNYHQMINMINLEKPIRYMVKLSQQLYPYSLECLIPPSNIHLDVKLLKQTSTSLRFRIELNKLNFIHKKQFTNHNCPPPSYPENNGIYNDEWQPSLSAIRYRIRYDTNCTKNHKCSTYMMETYNETIEINNLQPFTNYSFSIEIDNFYLELIRNRNKHRLQLAYNASLISTATILKNINDYNSIDLLNRPYLNWHGFIFRTLQSRPAPVRNVYVYNENPEQIVVLWDPPERLNAKKVIYEVRCHSQNNTLDLQSWRLDDKQIQSESNGTYRLRVNKMQPNTFYNITVRVYGIDNNNKNNYYVDNYQFQDSEIATIRTFSLPNKLIVKYLSPRQIDLEWQAPTTNDESAIKSHEIWYMQESNDKIDKNRINSEWTKFANDHTQLGQKYLYQFKHLQPNHWYRFKLIFIYSRTNSKYEWPKYPNIFRIQTNMTVPDGPEAIDIQNIIHGKDNAVNNKDKSKYNGINIYKIVWKPVQSNSDSIVYYQLYRWKLKSDDIHNGKNEMNNSIIINQQQYSLTSKQQQRKNSWTLVYNGTDTYWIITGLQTGHQYHFRLYASNRFGCNRAEYAQTMRSFWLGQPIEIDNINNDLITASTASFGINEESHLYILLFTLFSSIAICLISFSICSLRIYKLRAKEIDTNNETTSSTVANNPQIELIPWQQRPHPHLPNALYMNSDAQDIDLSDIEIFDYRTITLIKSLGKGAFGEVHEAILHKTEQRVAVKVLNKNLTKDEDQCNFLKEAKFMSKFKHPHILQLLGVCLNHNSSPIIIVLELMEAGDLLKYLRSNRPNSKQMQKSNKNQLTIDDLLSICIDIAKGCEYLEQKQFVHRDLAARNCLVSSVDRSKRVVKIADFGLTRGLYQQNYYRKEGGLMPVRWMSPESLSDGVFTTQSDVWSYSVIMYEVMTLGQQPYQAYSNKEVLEFVKSGGILECPPLCPQQMYQLMKQCWNYEKELRPSFEFILKTLQQLQQTIRDEFDQLLKQQQYQNLLQQNNRLSTVHNRNYQNPLIDNDMLQQCLQKNLMNNQQFGLIGYCNMQQQQQQQQFPHSNQIIFNNNQKIFEPSYNTISGISSSTATTNGYLTTANNTTLTTLDDHNSLFNDDLSVHHLMAATNNDDNNNLTRIISSISPTLVLNPPQPLSSSSSSTRQSSQILEPMSNNNNINQPWHNNNFISDNEGPNFDNNNHYRSLSSPSASTFASGNHLNLNQIINNNNNQNPNHERMASLPSSSLSSQSWNNASSSTTSSNHTLYSEIVKNSKRFSNQLNDSQQQQQQRLIDHHHHHHIDMDGYQLPNG